MAHYKQTRSIQTKRLVEWFRDNNGNHEIKITIPGYKPIVFKYDCICDANRQYEHLAAL